MLGLGLGANKSDGILPEPFDYTVFNYSADVISSEDGWQLFSIEGNNSTLSYNQTIESLGDDANGWMQWYVGDTQLSTAGVQRLFSSTFPPGADPTFTFDIAFIPDTGWDPQNDTDVVSFYITIGGKSALRSVTPGVVNSISAGIVGKTTQATDRVIIQVLTADDYPNAGSSMLIKNFSVSFL